MEKEWISKLSNKMASHFPSKDGGCSMSGSPGQEPYRNELLRIFCEAFNGRDKEDENDISWGRLDEKLKSDVLNNYPHISYEEMEDKFEQTRDMWNEWLYIMKKIVNEDGIYIQDTFGKLIKITDGF